MTTLSSEQRLRLRLPPNNGIQRNQPRPGVLDSGSSVEAAEMASHPSEKTQNRDHGDSISVLPDGTRRKGDLGQLVSK